MTTESLTRLPLEDRHEALGARFAPFAGWRMPLQYSGIKDEHAAVREAVGLFDVSHMGNVFIEGPDAVRAIDALVTNDISSLPQGKAAYTVMCQEDGGIIDDLIVYTLAADRVMVIVNASRREVDLAHMRDHLEGDVTLEDRTLSYALLALQGPKAAAVLSPRVEAEVASIDRYAARASRLDGVEVIIARTGYTGEDGFEVLVPEAEAGRVFDALMAEGAGYGIQPAGLGARDTLRLEARYPLYGNELTTETNPLEAGLGWVVKLDKEVPFIGQEALRELRQSKGVTRRLRGVIMEARGVLRPGYELFDANTGASIGALTSGTMSPTLGYAIGLAYVDRAHANQAEGVEVEIRGRRVPVRLTKKPFYRGL